MLSDVAAYVRPAHGYVRTYICKRRAFVQPELCQTSLRMRTPCTLHARRTCKSADYNGVRT